jgi:hypothetical protein
VNGLATTPGRSSLADTPALCDDPGFGGRLDVRSPAGAGTIVVTRLPLGAAVEVET